MDDVSQNEKVDLASLRISLCDDWQLKDIQADWETLQGRATPNAYLSWLWISSWLAMCPNRPLCVQAFYQKELVGMGFLYPTESRFLPGISVKKLWLNRIGDDGLDQIWIEHNDLLLDERFQEQIREKMIHFLQFESGYDELYYGLSTEHSIKKLCTDLRPHRVVLGVPSYSLNLSDFSSKDDYLFSLSKNTRSQIVRTHKLISKKYGAPALSLPQSKSEKEEYLQQASILHQQRWSQSEFGSGFDNDVFTQFHRELLVGDASNTETRLYKLQAGEKVFGYIYLLTDADSWKFYLSAIRFDDDNRIKVGLLFHTLVIEEAIKQGVGLYDFLAGEARYKKSLSNREEQQLMCCFYKPSMIIRVRELLRAFKKCLLQ